MPCAQICRETEEDGILGSSKTTSEACSAREDGSQASRASEAGRANETSRHHQANRTGEADRTIKAKRAGEAGCPCQAEYHNPKRGRGQCVAVAKHVPGGKHERNANDQPCSEYEHAAVERSVRSIIRDGSFPIPERRRSGRSESVVHGGVHAEPERRRSGRSESGAHGGVHADLHA